MTIVQSIELEQRSARAMDVRVTTKGDTKVALLASGPGFGCFAPSGMAVKIPLHLLSYALLSYALLGDFQEPFLLAISLETDSGPSFLLRSAL